MTNHALFGRFIRYAPCVLLFCTVLKMYLLSTTNGLTATNMINLVLNYLMLWMVYVQGVTLDYCWKHRSLCRLCAWEYAYYFVIGISNTPSSILDIMLLFNILFAIIILVYYRLC